MFTTIFSFFFFNDTATTEIYTLSLHDALPISLMRSRVGWEIARPGTSLRTTETVAGCKPSRSASFFKLIALAGDRKSTRLNSSHLGISYAVFCLKKKKKKDTSSDHAVHDVERK